ncbi:cysteine desulfurase-like protein [Actinotalea sp. Marseille-Q4924]|uniref:cysteine desulfurase-like protein n=1 Tax=Actinotalea sp. Marseille-Q4924 TaxID=2866571 RepID=UPI001CE3CC2C|nr:cysteine desulfurase-like protein [Actinotalea sp. Marseille-Q4924]
MTTPAPAARPAPAGPAPGTYDVAAFRARFPALVEGAAHFDGPGGSQVPGDVARAVADAMTAATANAGTVTRAELRARDVVLGARAALGDLLGVDPRGVVVGRSMTQLTFDLARTLAAGWGLGDEVVVSRLDHDANIRPWVLAAEAAGVSVRWADFEPSTGELDVDAVAAVVGPRTRVVAVTAASNLIGTRPDVPAIARVAHEVGALLVVDGVHSTAHVPTDVPALGADVYLCSPYKLMGPHVGVMAAAPAFLETLHPAKLLPSTDAVPERFELGTLPYELLAGCTAAVEVLAGLGDEAADGPLTTRRERVLAGMAAVEAHEDRLRARLETAVTDLGGITSWSRARRRTPTVLLRVDGVPDEVVTRRLAERGVNAPRGSFYALEASRHLGLGDGGAVRVGLAPYTDDDDVTRLLEGLAALRSTGG